MNKPTMSIAISKNHLKQLQEEWELDRGDVPGINTCWSHGNGNIYRVTSLTNFGGDNSDKFPFTVSYQDTDSGLLWSRPLSRWHESMTEIPED